MNPTAPHYILFSQSRDDSPGVWRFVLRSASGSDELEVVDSEPGVRGERLELLSMVRGLEALDQPSKVTVVTPSKYVREGIRYGLPEWRSNGWCWESFGEMVPVKNCDLWQRVDRALRFHEVDCRRWRLDAAHAAAAPPPATAVPKACQEHPDETLTTAAPRRGWREQAADWGRRVICAARGYSLRSTRWWAALVLGDRLG